MYVAINSVGPYYNDLFRLTLSCRDRDEKNSQSEEKQSASHTAAVMYSRDKKDKDVMRLCYNIHLYIIVAVCEVLKFPKRT